MLTILSNLSQGPGPTWAHLVDTVLLDYVMNTLILMAGVGGICVVIGVGAAWFVSNFDFPGRGYLQWGLILPLSIPTYIVAYTYAGIFDFTGPLQRLLTPFLDRKVSLPDIMNIGGVTVVMAMVLFPYVYLISRASFLNNSRRLIEASQILGQSPTRTFFKIAFPVARPAVVAGLSLAFMEVLNDYGAVKYYGVTTFTTGIFRAWFSLGDSSAAIYLSSILMLFVLLLLAIEKLHRGKMGFAEDKSSFGHFYRIRLSGTKALAVSIFCFLPFLFGFLIPVAQLVSWSIQTAGGLVPLEVLRWVVNSFGLAVLASFITVAFSVILIFCSRTLGGSWIRPAAKLATIGYSIPGAIIAIGILIPLLALDRQISVIFNSLFEGPGPGLVLSGTVFALVVAYTVRYLAVAFNPIESGFEKIGDPLIEASRSLGRGLFATLRRINLPLLRTAALAGAILVFVDLLKELPLTLILRPFNFDTLATKTYELASDELIPQSASPSLIIIGIGIIPIFLLNRLLERKPDQ